MEDNLAEVIELNEELTNNYYDEELEQLKLEEIKTINKNLGDLIDLITTIEEKNELYRQETADYRSEVIEYVRPEDLEEIETLEIIEEEPEYMELLRSIETNTIPVESYNTLDVSRNELLTTISDNTVQVEEEKELQDLEILSQSAILVILSLIVVYGVFYFVRYVYNSLTRHF